MKTQIVVIAQTIDNSEENKSIIETKYAPQH